MMTFAKQWDTWWTRTCPPHTLALIRIMFGTYLIFYWCVHLPRIEMLFSSSGLVVPLYMEGPFAQLIGPMTPLWTLIMYWSLLLCLILFTLGWDIRTNALIISGFMLYYYHLSFHLFPNTYNRLYLFLILVLAFGGADNVYSLKMKIEKGSWSAYQPISIWPIRLIAIQLTATFTGVSYQKLFLPLWQESGAVYYPFIGCWGTPLAYWIARHNLTGAFYGSLLWTLKIVQCALPIGFWVPKFRLLAIIFASLFLLAVAVLLSIWWFLILIPCFIVFFPPEMVHRQLNYWHAKIKIRANDR